MHFDKKKFFYNKDIRLAYLDYGVGEPILLIHGFASNTKINWVSTGWFKFLLDAGYRVIAIDNRGHGDSDKIYELSAYTPENMAEDAYALLQHLNINKVSIMGYSMGARVAAYFALQYPKKVKKLIFGGLGIGMVTGAGSWEPVAEALLAENIDDIKNTRGLMFRKFADATKSDKKALAFCVITSKKELKREQVAKIYQPCLIVVGENDEISGKSTELADIMPNATAVSLPGRNHMLAVGDKLYKSSTLEFLQRS